MSVSVLWGLFISAFVAASIFPAQSELFLAGALAKDYAPLWAMIAAASLGNTLGSATNWLLGRFFIHYQDRSWFPIKHSNLARAEACMQVRALVAAFKLDACCGRPHHARSGDSARTLPLIHRHCGCGKNSPLYRGCADYLAVHLRMKNSGLKQAELNRIAVPTRAPISANRPAIM